VTHIGLLDGSGNEISGGDPAYARQEATFGDPSGSEPAEIGNTNLMSFHVPPATTVARLGFYTAPSGGTLIADEPLIGGAATSTSQAVTPVQPGQAKLYLQDPAD